MVRCVVKLLYDYCSNVATDKKSQQAVCSNVAKALRREREKRGLSMNLIAEKSGLSQQMVSYVEREMRNPTLETLLRISVAMDIELWKVIREAESTK